MAKRVKHYWSELSAKHNAIIATDAFRELLEDLDFSQSELIREGLDHPDLEFVEQDVDYLYVGLNCTDAVERFAIELGLDHDDLSAIYSYIGNCLDYGVRMIDSYPYDWYVTTSLELSNPEDAASALDLCDDIKDCIDWSDVDRVRRRLEVREAPSACYTCGGRSDYVCYGCTGR